ncbi:MAG: quinoprotein dehydrogenase-associated SoxYZ-like carrier [Rubrimonas sp.]
MRVSAIVIAAVAAWATAAPAQQTPAPQPADPAAAAEQPSAAWDDLRPLIYGQRPIAEAGEMIRIDAPVRAHDAAVVPIEIAIVPPLGRTVSRFSLIIDENPAPVAAEFEVGPGLGREIAMSTRVRIDAYSNVRVVAEFDDGALYQTARFVKASGGCSAPALKDAQAALDAAGQMRMRVFQGDAAAPEAQIAIRHPNYSGFQMNQVTLLRIPAYYVDRIEVAQGDRMVFRMEGGISLSEDPSIRFRYVPNGVEPFTVRASDNSGAEFEGLFPASADS